MIEQVAEGVVRIPVVPLDGVNCYLLEDVLVDAGFRSSEPKIRAALEGRSVAAHALTHAHPDHQGSSRALCLAYDVPFWCGEGDREVAESGDLVRLFSNPAGLAARLSSRMGGPGHLVEQTLSDGDHVGDFVVLETPGHTPGHLAFWRPHDRLLVLGDVALAMNPFTMLRGLRTPPRLATPDPERNLASLRKLAVLGPEIVCFGHGPVLRDGEAFQRFVHAVAPAH